MGQFAEQECKLPVGFRNMTNIKKATIASRLCQEAIGIRELESIININDGRGTWLEKAEKMRKIFNAKGWRLVVKRKK
jgi:hypothetical protein